MFLRKTSASWSDTITFSVFYENITGGAILTCKIISSADGINMYLIKYFLKVIFNKKII
jgi:hypothetical protein